MSNRLLTTRFGFFGTKHCKHGHPSNWVTNSNKLTCAIVCYLSQRGPVYPGRHWSHSSSPPLLKWQVGLKLEKLPSGCRSWSCWLIWWCCPSVERGWRRKREKRRQQRQVKAIICLSTCVQTPHTLKRVPLPSLSKSSHSNRKTHTHTSWSLYTSTHS